MARRRGRPRALPAVPCPEPGHEGSIVVANGTRRVSAGLRRQFRCSPVSGPPHWFAVVLPEDDNGTTVPVARWSPPPACGQHPGSRVVRWGTYGKRTASPRQRYRCYPDDGSPAHVFTPPLPRDHVHHGNDTCPHCEELRGVHRGEAAVARRHSWSSRVVARGLEMLSAGTSYAEVSRWALRVTGNDSGVVRRRPKPTTDGEADPRAAEPPVAGGAAGGKKRKVSRASMESRNAWHIAADWCEVFSPAVYGPLDERLRTQALTDRASLDEEIAAGGVPARPQVWLLDDVPVYGRGKEGTSRRDAGFFVLVLAEVTWLDDDPWAARPTARQRIRVARAMAKSNADAWRLVFDEMGYAPDVVVSDAGTGILAALDAHFDPSRTRFVPSLWHLRNAIVNGLDDTPGAFVPSPAGRQLRPDLAEHLDGLARGKPALDSVDGWHAWWDQLETLLAAAKLPRDKVRTRRARYEAQMDKVLPYLLDNPQVPVSTGGLETLINKSIQPMLSMRRSGFANIERTNRLLDLAVARVHGSFDDLAEVAALLRTDATAFDGWTATLREVADPRPRTGRYSSLRDAALLADVAAARGLT